ncbi:MAG: M20/M25/M40 family metallo-hydrolase [Thermoanaerobaculia bacterium]
MGVAERLAELVAIPSVSGNEKWLAERLAAILLDGGAAVAQDGRNVFARRGEGGPTLLLNSHIDTVPPVDGWTDHPWNPRVEGDRLIGLGSNDAKASVAAMVEAFLSAPLPPEGTLLFAATCDEETGGEGLEKLAPQLTFDAAVIGEPNDFAVAVAQKGLVKLKLTARGRSGHAARPHLAQNALIAAARDIFAIESLSFDASDPFLGEPTAAVTMIQGGLRSNIIPDHCELTVDARTIPAFDNERMIAAIRAAVSSDVEVLSARLKPVTGDPGWSIARAALEAAPGSTVTGFPSVSDLAHLAGKPAIVFGPGAPDQSHKADESVSLSKLAEAPEIYRRLIAAWFRLEAGA